MAKTVTRLHSHHRHQLTFEIPVSVKGINVLKFRTHEEIMGIEIGYDVDDGLLNELGLAKSHRRSENLERFVRKFCPKRSVVWVVRETLKWVSRLGLNLNKLCIQFVPELMLGGGFMGRGITGNRRRALLLLEFMLDQRGMAFPADEYVEDIIPHELMHIKDVLDGRAPTVYPGLLPGEGEWIDLIRHLWIDGYLEQLGIPHYKKEGRILQLAESLKDIGKGLSADELSMLVRKWWGKPMTLRDSIRVGLDLGFPLKKGCPMEKWFAAKSG